MLRLVIVSLVVALGASNAPAAEQAARRTGADGQKQQAKKPNPCAPYGPGFAMLPGTTTCVRIGGSVVGDFGAGRGSAPNLGVK